MAASIRDRNALCTVAFNYPDTIAVQQALLQKYVSGCERLILDNSSDASAVREIRRIADRFEVSYLRLPRIRPTIRTTRTPALSTGRGAM